MGCVSSKSEGPGKREAQSGENPQRLKIESDPDKNDSKRSMGSVISREELKVHRDRMRKLQELDGTTNIPFILVELRGVSHKKGFVEVCGKDECGVYLRLEEWLLSFMKCQKLDAGTLSDETSLPMSDALYQWDGFMVDGKEGTNNMGLATMQLVEFMCTKLCWTLGAINGGNVGENGEIREQQVIFKAPHPMNMEAHHIMIELRSAGYIEVCGSSIQAKDSLHDFFVKKWVARRPQATRIGLTVITCVIVVFSRSVAEVGRTISAKRQEVCDAVVRHLQGWTLVTMNGGNYGDGGCHREQQLVFRLDNHPLAAAPPMLIKLREGGFIEVCGEDVDGITAKLTDWFKATWGSTPSTGSLSGQEPFCNKSFVWKAKDMMVASAELTDFFHGHGWQMIDCSHGTVAISGNARSREQQIVFRPGASSIGIVEPHLFIELYSGEGNAALYKTDKMQVPANQVIRVRQVGNCQNAVKELSQFIVEYLGGQENNNSNEWLNFSVDVFLLRGMSDNNLGTWTMRMCNFMVNRLGWNFVVCNVCNLGPLGNFREQQLVFRYDGEQSDIPPVKDDNARLDEIKFVDLDFPDHWKNKKVLSLKQTYGIVSCTRTEVSGMQAIFDQTFNRVLTWDRVYEYQLNSDEEIPYRLEVVHAFRSEHAELYRRFMERRAKYKGDEPKQDGRSLHIKTLGARGIADKLKDRLGQGEALLAYGINPSSASGILKTGFKLSAASKATGTMFGCGIYLAECVAGRAHPLRLHPATP